MATYTVQAGDTLTGIAVKLGLCAQPASNTPTGWAPCLAVAEQFKAANPQLIRDVNKITPGWVLQVPGTGKPDVAIDTSGPKGWSSLWLLALMGTVGAVIYLNRKS